MAVLMTKLDEAVYSEEWNEVILVGRGLSLTGTIVNLLVDIKMAPPLIDMCIVPEVPTVLYVLFDYWFTIIHLLFPTKCLEA